MGSAVGNPKHRSFAPLFWVGWAIAASAGYAALKMYEATPRVPGTSLPSVHARLEKSRLVVFVHPQCKQCPETVSAIESIRKQAGTSLEVIALVWTPRIAPVGWKTTPAIQRLQSLPEVSVRFDSSGLQARRFGAKVSGTAILFDHDGNVVFRGGLNPTTPSQVPSRGERAIQDFLRTGAVPVTAIPAEGRRLPEIGPNLGLHV